MDKKEGEKCGYQPQKHPSYVTFEHKEWHGNFCPICLTREPLFWDKTLFSYRRRCVKGHSVEVDFQVAKYLLQKGIGFFW